MLELLLSLAIASHGNSGRLADPVFFHFWAGWIILRLHVEFQLPRSAETTQLYFSGWPAGRPAKPEINANLSPAWLAGAWAELGNKHVFIILHCYFHCIMMCFQLCSMNLTEVVQAESFKYTKQRNGHKTMKFQYINTKVNLC